MSMKSAKESEIAWRSEHDQEIVSLAQCAKGKEDKEIQAQACY